MKFLSFSPRISAKRSDSGRQHKQIRRLSTNVITAALFVGVFAVSGLGHAQGSIQITGLVTDQSGHAVQGAEVTATDPGSNTVDFGPVATEADGSYELDVDAGTYDFHFAPPSASGLNAVVENNVTVNNGQTINVQFTSVTHTISGTLTDNSNNPIQGFQITASKVGDNNVFGQTTTDANGHYSISVPPAGYYLSLSNYFGGGPLSGMTLNQDYTTPSINLADEDITQNLVITKANIHVTVKDAEGNPIAGASVNAYDGHGGTTHLYSGDAGESIQGLNNTQTTDANGNADFTSIVGALYNAGANGICATVSGSPVCLASDLTLTGDTTLVFQQAPTPTTHTLSGTITDSDGNPIANSQIGIYGVTSTRSDANGHYSVTLDPGTYTLIVSDPAVTSFDGSLSHYQLRDTAPIDLTNGDVTQDLKLDTVKLAVTVKDAAGNPLTNRLVYVTETGDGTTDLDASQGANFTISETDSYGRTDDNGQITMITIKGAQFNQQDGLTQTTHNICASADSTGQPPFICIPAPFTATQDTAITLTQAPVMHTFSGTMTDSQNNPVLSTSIVLFTADGNVVAQNVTDSTGHFSMTAPAGDYALVTSSNAVSNPADKINSLGLSQSENNVTDIDLTNGNVNRDLHLNTVRLHVTVKDSAGHVVSNASVTSSVPTDTNTTTLYAGDPGEIVRNLSSRGTTDSNGTVDLGALVGSTYTTDLGTGICAVVGTQNVCLTAPLTVTGDTDIVLQQPSVNHTFSGTLTDSQNNPVLSTSIVLFKADGNVVAQNVTDSTGHFSMTAPAGAYALVTSSNAVTNPADKINSLALSQSDRQVTGIDLTNSDINVALHLNTVRLHVTVKDAAGHAVSNTAVTSSVNPGAFSTTLYAGDPGETVLNMSSHGTTDSNGTVDLGSLVGVSYTTEQGMSVCATIASQPVCLTAPLTITGDTNILLQPPVATPPAPTNLTIPSPTTAPALSWTASGGADSYNIYRNGSLLDTSTTTSYTDTTADLGNNSYYVTAVNSGGESGPSNTVTVQVGSISAITSAASASTSLRAAFDFKIITTGNPTPSLTESGVLPTGIVFTDNGDGTADLAGVAALGTAGTYPVTFTASNGIGSDATQSFVLTVTSATSAPSFTSANNDTETFGLPFSFTVSTNGYPVAKLTKTGALPAGVTFTDNNDGTATISGTPAQSAVGTYNLTLKAKSTAGTATQSFALAITKAPIFKSLPNKTATVGTAFSTTVTATGFTSPTITAAGLPNGVTLTDNGNGTATIAGTPATGSGGSYTVTLTATNQLGSSTGTFTLKVNEAPTITSASSTTATVGSPFSFSVTSTGYPAPVVSKTGTLPKGITFKGSTDTFSGTPKAGSAGTYHITVKAKNSTGTVTQNLTIVVSDPIAD